MNRAKCVNGHFFDSERFRVCPICGQPMSTKQDWRFTPSQEVSNALSAGNIQFAMPSSRGYSAETPVFSRSASPAAEQNPVEQQPLRPAAETVLLTQRQEAEERDGELARPQSSADHVGVSERSFPVGWLVGKRGVYRGRAFALAVGRNRIGRAPEAEIGLPQEETIAAGTHAQIIYDPRRAGFFIQSGADDGQTTVNGETLFSYSYEELHAYDTVCMGEAEFLFLPLCGEKFTWD